jgi:alkaline phosphatase D
VVGATLSGLPGCGDDKTSGTPDAAGQGSKFTFPQGLASGDPRDTSVVLWTRVEAKDGSSDPIPVTVRVASDASFGTVVVDMAITASSDADHTVRVVVTGLAAGTSYYYRFIAGTDTIDGQTRTAPASDADAQVNLGWVSCQDYQPGTYGSYRQMLLDDDARAEADKIHFVVHLGDAIYETIDGGFQVPLDDSYQPTTVTNADGSDRAIAAFPSGGGNVAGNVFAQTVEDYRHLYRTYLSDPDFQAARARWPFIHTWDDHEFTDDSWQSQANYTDNKTLDEPSQTRKVAASQAWFEFIPCQLTGAVGVSGVTQDAKDFAAVTVTDADFTDPNADNFVDEPNNAKAVGAMTIYRSLRFGQHCELVMTDLRSYRSDHALPEELTASSGFFFNPRNVLPIELVNTLDQGMTANGNSPPASVLGFPNPRTTSPVGTMLGAEQKQWWKDTMKGSEATWKIWGNEVPLMRFFIPVASVGLLFYDRVMDADAWDGYPTERAELMTYLKDQAIGNVVAITGDIHASFAGVVMDDFDAGTPVPVAAELIAAGISSNSVFSFYENATRPAAYAELRKLITVDASSASGSSFTENMNLLLLHGTEAAKTFGDTLDLTQALAAADPTVNPHLKYADTNAQGYGYLKITATQCEGTLVTINRPVGQSSDAGPGVKRTASFTIPKDDPASMTAPTITGTKPFPLT